LRSASTCSCRGNRTGQACRNNHGACECRGVRQTQEAVCSPPTRAPT
jgi:hypothetical protein